jgi:hypothetical protein
LEIVLAAFKLLTLDLQLSITICFSLIFGLELLFQIPTDSLLILYLVFKFDYVLSEVGLHGLGAAILFVERLFLF